MWRRGYSATEKYVKTREEEEEEEKEDASKVVILVSLSPSARAGLLPTSLTLNDLRIGGLGEMAGLNLARVTDLDLTSNAVTWTSVLAILRAFPRLLFLNLVHNKLGEGGLEGGLEVNV